MHGIAREKSRRPIGAEPRSLEFLLDFNLDHLKINIMQDLNMKLLEKDREGLSGWGRMQRKLKME